MIFMADKATAPVKTKSNGLNTKWIKNALKSIGVSSQEALKEIYPNLAEVTTSTAQSGKNILDSIRKNSNNAENVLNNLKNNKYVKHASQAYKNALEDLKSGNFNNTERMMGGMEDSFDDMFSDMGGDSGESSDVSFGDEDTGTTNNVSFNYVNKGDNNAILAFQEQSKKQSEAIIKTNKANMDAQIAVASASMYQLEKLGSEITTHLSNISNSLTALVDYNNQNMTRFIEASISYYESVGKKQEQSSSGGNKRLNAADVFNNKEGGINISQYKNYVKQQFKDTLQGSPLGMLEMLTDDSMLEMLVSNPLGFASKGLASYMIPKLVGTTIDSVEKTFSAFVPTMLNRLADWGDEYTTGMLGTLKRSVGQIFGLRIDQKNRINAAKVDKGPTPFDGETKHAITQVITKELREQTSYLEAIASHMMVNTKKAKQNADVWDYEQGKYIKVKDIQNSIATTIQDAFLNTFKNGRFGKAMQNLVYSQEGEHAQQSLQHTLDQFLTLAGRAKSSINLSDRSKNSEYTKIMDQLRKNWRDRKNVNILETYIQDLIQNDPNSANDFARSLLTAQAQRNTQIDDINNNPNQYNLFASGLNGANINNLIDEQLGYFKFNKQKRGKVKAAKVAPVNTENTGLLGEIFSSFTSRLSSQMGKAMSGDYSGANGEMVGLIKDQTSILFKRLSGTILRPFRNAMVGTGKEGEETVLGNLKSLGKELKEGILTKFLGEKGEDGKRSGMGIISKIGNIFTEGMIGWKEAFLGKEMDEKDKERFSANLVQSFKDRLPSSITGGIIGGGAGAAFGGILGNLIGGPFAGAILGSATGFLSKSEKFMELIFGKKDEDGNRLGGIISKKVQDFIKENKSRLVGGATVGGITGALGITGNGLLGTLIGGPFAGAIMGMGSSILLKSNMFSDFLFGSEKTGQKGLFKGIADAFNQHAKRSSKESASISGKQAGMTAIGIGGGALTGALLTKFGVLGAALGPFGPIGGALAGLGLSIKASGGSFREWLFGKDEQDIHGNTVHRQGIIGQFGNMLSVNVFRPILHTGEYIFKDLASSIKYEVLTPFAFLSEAVAGIAGDIYAKFRDTVTKGFNTMGEMVQEKIVSKIGAALAPFTDTMAKAAEVAAFAAKNAALLPFRLLRKGMEVIIASPLKYITEPLGFLIDEVKNAALAGVKTVTNYVLGGVKKLFNVVTAPVRFVGGLIGTGINKAYNYVQNKRAEKLEQEGESNWGTKEGTLAERIQRASIDRKKDKERLRVERRNTRIHDKNARLIAKYTNNQFGADTEEGRKALRRAKPSAYRKLNLNVESEDVQKEKAKIAKEGKSTAGLSGNELSGVDPKTLNEQGKQTWFLHEIYRTVVRGEKPKDVVAKEENEKKKKENGDVDTDQNDVDTNDDAMDIPNTSNASFREYFKSVGLDLASFFFGEDIVDAVTGKKTGKTKGVIGRSGEAAANEGKGLWNYLKGVGGRFKTMTSDLSEYHQGRKANKYIQKHGKLPEGYEEKQRKKIEGPQVVTEEPQETQEGGEGKGRATIRGGFGKRGGFGSFIIPKSLDALPVFIKDVAKTVENKLTDSGDAKRVDELVDKARATRLQNAKDRGVSAKEREEMLKEQEQQEREEENNTNIATTAQATVAHEKNWGSIFGKKGLITGGLMLLSPLLLKLLKWLISGPGKELGNLLLNGLKGLVGFLGSGIGTITDTIKNWLSGINQADEDKSRTNGESMGEAASGELENAKDTAKELSQGDILGAWNTFVTDENGNTTHSTFAKNKFIARQVYNNPITRNVVKGTGKLVNKVGKTTVSKLSENRANKRILKAQVGSKGAKALRKQYGSYKEAVEHYGGEVVDSLPTKAKAKVAKFSDDAVKAVQKSASSLKENNKIVNKVLSYVDKFVSFVVSKATTLGGKVTESALGTVVKNVKSVIQSASSLIAKRAAKILGSDAAVAVATAGVGWIVKNGLFVTLGALNGSTGAARLFQVDQKYVDGTMTAISTIFGGIAGSTIGSIIDMVNEVVVEITGSDFLSELAAEIYLRAKGTDKANKLKEGQEEFYGEYLDYQTSEIEKSYYKALQDGTIDADMTLDEYRENVNNGFIEVEYKSFADYNDKKHKTMGARVSDTATQMVSDASKGIKNLGKKVKDTAKDIGKKVKDSFTNKNKNKSAYLDTSKIRNRVTDDQLQRVADMNLGPVQRREQVKLEKGDSAYLDTSKIKNTVTKEKMDKVMNTQMGPVQRRDKATTTTPSTDSSSSSTTNGLMKIIRANLSSTTVYVNDGDGSYYKGDGSHYTATGTYLGKIEETELMKLITSNQVHQTTLDTDPNSIQMLYRKTVGGFVKNTQDQIENLKNTWGKGSKIKQKALDFVNDGISSLNTFVENFLSGKGSKGKTIFGTKTTTVYMDTNGNYYKPKGNGFDYCNPNGEVIKTGVSAEEVGKLMEVGVITETKEIKNTAAQEAVVKIQTAVKNTWDKAKNFVSNAWDSFTGFIDKLWNNDGVSHNYVNYQQQQSISPGTNTLSGTYTNRPLSGGNGRGGRGGKDNVNGFSYYSQSDPRWKNKPYNTGNDDATMDDSGCGPTAFSMVASQMTGRDVNPMETAQLAEVTGNRDNTGTNWNFINQAANTYGIGSQEVENPSSDYINEQLDQGKPMILSGASGGGFGVKSGSAYTPAGHYVVAVGKDEQGNVIINDPRGKQYSGKYNLDQVASETGAAWSFDNSGGYGTRRKKPLRRILRRGGYGKKTGNANWMSCVTAVKSAIAQKVSKYSQSHSTPITVNGKTVKVRDDCSGFVSGVLNFYGAFSNSYMTSSRGFVSDSGVAKKLQDAGFVKKSFTSWDDLVQGDIIALNGHVEIFDHNSGGKHYVYSNGSTNGIKSTEPRQSSRSSYTVVWRPPASGGASISGGSTVGVGSDYPKYTDLSESDKDTLATLITGETGGKDEVAARQEASQIANLNESKGRSKDAEGIIKTAKSGWYASSSFTRGKTKIAEQAVEDVIVNGHRTFPRYVVEHDWFPNDIKNAKDRSEYTLGDPVSNKYGSDYKFYTFMGKNKGGDIAGYFDNLYKKYKDDVPWGEGAVGSDATGMQTSADETTVETTTSKSLFDAIGDYASATVNAAIGGILTGNYDTSQMMQAWNGATVTGGTTTTGNSGDYTIGGNNSGSTITSTGVSTNNIPKKEKETGNKKYPKTIMVNGTTYKIPQQTEFGAWSKKHGCSIAAANLGIQRASRKVVSLDDIYGWMHKNLPDEGIAGSAQGILKSINELSGVPNAAKWYPVTKNNKEKAAQNIDNAINNGSFVILGQKDPYHFTTFIGRKKNGYLGEVTNGDYKNKWNYTAQWKVNNKAITGSGKESEQTDWWKGARTSGGYVVVDGPSAMPKAGEEETLTNKENTTIVNEAKNGNKNTDKKGNKGGNKGNNKGGKGGFGVGLIKKPTLIKNGFNHSIHTINKGGYGNHEERTNTIHNHIRGGFGSISEKTAQRMVQLLEQIASNTLSSSEKLELLKDVNKDESVTNIYADANSEKAASKRSKNAKKQTTPKASNKKSDRGNNANGMTRNQKLAYKISLGV